MAIEAAERVLDVDDVALRTDRRGNGDLAGEHVLGIGVIGELARRQPAFGRLGRLACELAEQKGTQECYRLRREMACVGSAESP